jgi:anion-transporting  ArsA/GET3 family ATPase
VNGPAPELLDRRLLLFTGKGGVGKSTMAAATALLAASIGKRVLLVEVDAKGDVPAQFEQSPVGFAPREIYPGVLAMAMDTEASLQEYLRLNLRIPVLGRLGPLARVLDFVATAAPGVKEILTIGKIAWDVRESLEGRADYDLVVVDAAATGHIVAQLGAADAIRELVDVGPLRNQTQWVSDLLADPAITAVNIVTTPEEMPVAETIELVERLRNEVRVPLGSVIVNRVLPELFTRADEETFESLRAPAGARVLTEHAGPGATAVLDAARLAVSLRRTRAVHLDHLLEAVDLPLLYVPYLFVRTHGLRVTRMVADALGQELGL